MRFILPLIASLIIAVGCTSSNESNNSEPDIAAQKQELLDIIEEKEMLIIKTSVKDKDATAQLLYNHYIDYAEVYQDDELAPDMLFKAAELANALGNYEDAVAIFERIEKHYKTYLRVPEAVFLQGFVYDNYLRQKGVAKERYERFIERYPNHQLVEQARLSIQYLGMSDEEIIEQFEQKSTE